MPQLRLVKNINPKESSNPENLYAVEDTLFFAAEGDDRTDVELWASDGTALGTRLVKDLYPDPFQGSDPGGEEYRSASSKLAMANLNGALLFRAWGKPASSEVFISDGTEEGTRLLKDIRQDVSSFAADFEVIDDQLFFRATNNDGQRSLFVTDGTPAETRQVINLNPSGDDLPYKSFLTSFKDDLYYRGLSVDEEGVIGQGNKALYRVDGETGAVERVHQSNPDTYLGSGIQEIHAAGDRLFFGATYPGYTFGRLGGNVSPEDYGGINYNKGGYTDNKYPALFVTDGPKEGVRLASSNRWSRYGAPADFEAAGNRLFFMAGLTYEVNPTGYDKLEEIPDPQGQGSTAGLWVSDGTDQGTRRLRMFNGSRVNDTDQFPKAKDDSLITAVGNRVFFVADDGNTGRELWTSDGTTAGTRLVSDLYPGSESSDPSDFLVKGDQLFFTATNPAAGRELWITDGTAAGTQRITDLNPGKNDANPSDLALMGNTVYFSATNQDDDRELYAYGDPLPNYTPNPVEEATIDSNDVLTKEGDGKDKIKGTKQDDIIGAGSGADQMQGGKGADSFYWGFDLSVSFGKKQADRVTDFKAGQGDQIVLDADAFGGFGASFTFSVASNKKELQEASRAGADLIYFEAKGYLYFDQNEEGKGFGNGGVFAVLNKKPELDAANIGFTALPGDMF